MEKQGTCGAEAVALDRFYRMDLPIPRGIVISTELYRMFVEDSGLQTDISIALETKALDQMRWEEVWSSLWSDCALIYFKKLDLGVADPSMALVV